MRPFRSAAAGDAAEVRAAADRISAENAEVRRAAATDRNRALAAERALEQQTKLAENAAADASRATARAAAAEDRAAAAEKRAKLVALEAETEHAMAVREARMDAEREASAAKRATEEALRSLNIARASQQWTRQQAEANRRVEQIDWIRSVAGGDSHSFAFTFTFSLSLFTFRGSTSSTFDIFFSLRRATCAFKVHARAARTAMHIHDEECFTCQRELL